MAVLGAALTTNPTPAEAWGPAARAAKAPPPSAAMLELKRRANEAAGRYNRAQNDQVRLRDQVADVEQKVGDLEQRMTRLRQAATRGAAGLYMHDPVTDTGWALDSPEAVLSSGRRMRLMGSVNNLAGEAVLVLDKAAAELRGQRQVLERRRREQQQVVNRLADERKTVDRQLVAMAKAEKEALRQAAAAPRPAVRTSRSQPPPVARPQVPGSFICPIRGPVAFSDDFGGRRNHKGNDLMNPKGTENVAVVAGTASTKPWSGGGLVVFLAGDDGVQYVYMHLSKFVGALPRHVEQGEVIGLTGMTGNASAYHTHFEIRPGGGAAINPHPLIAAHC